MPDNGRGDRTSTVDRAVGPTGSIKRRVGRPPKLDRQMIAEAAHEIGLADLTMKSVADRLGVSVPGLYHHVGGKDDLLRLTAEYSAAHVELPRDRHQHWAVWLFEWAHYNRDAFLGQPELLKQYLEGAIGFDRTSEIYEQVLGLLTRDGFTIDEAVTAYTTISTYAIGAAVSTIREARAEAEGRPSTAGFERVLAERGPDELPHLRAVVAGGGIDPGALFDQGLLSILRGMVRDRDEPWPAVRARLRRASLPRAQE
jgi:AcrR family transcriptional regulator